MPTDSATAVSVSGELARRKASSTVNALLIVEDDLADEISDSSETGDI
jgi:hypothetical protein